MRKGHFVWSGTCLHAGKHTMVLEGFFPHGLQDFHIFEMHNSFVTLCIPVFVQDGLWYRVESQLIFCLSWQTTCASVYCNGTVKCLSDDAGFDRLLSLTSIGTTAQSVSKGQPLKFVFESENILRLWCLLPLPEKIVELCCECSCHFCKSWSSLSLTIVSRKSAMLV